MESTTEVRREIDATKARMSATVGEIEARIHGKVDAVKQKVDIIGLARDNPWPALLVAVIAGAAIAASDSDRKAASATVRAAKKAPRATGRALKATATGTAHLAGSAVKRLRGGHDDGAPESDGLLARTKSRLAERFSAQARELGEHLARAADDIVRSTGARSGGTGSDGRNRLAAGPADLPPGRTDAALDHTTRYDLP